MLKSLNGWVEDLPSLQTDRLWHGCGHFFSETNGLVKIIDNYKENEYSREPENGYSRVKLGSNWINFRSKGQP